MAEAATKEEHPERFRWNGVRFKKVRPLRDDVVRYESEDMLFYGWVRLCDSGQWMAAFTDGMYSIEWDRDDALESARLKNIDHLYDKAARFEALGYRKPLW